MPSLRLAPRAIAWLALPAAIGACETPSLVGQLPAVATVAVAAPVAELAVGQTTIATVTLRDATGAVLPLHHAISWRTSDPTVATVTQGGEIAALAAGSVRVGVATDGRYGEVALTVVPRSALVASITLDATALVLDAGQTRQLVATPRDAQGLPVDGVTVEWTAESASAAAAVTTSGVVTAREMGTATIHARVGSRVAQATVTVLGDGRHELVFDRWGADAGNVQRSWLHRLDLRTPGAEPVGIFASAGTADAAPSPDGTRLAFVCETGSGSGICVANRDGTGVAMLPGFGTPTGLRADQPAWSPDGMRIAFRGWAMGGDPGIFNPASIWAVNADGSGMTRLVTGVANEATYASPEWSPRLADGTYRIAFSRVTRSADGYLVANLESARIDGQDRRAITTPGAFVDAAPSWSPDGTTIAFVRTGGTVSGDVWLVGAGGGGERPLMSSAIEPAGAQRAPAWSPDGGQIAFASDHEIIGNYVAWQIYTVRADGTGLVRRTSDRAEKGNPAWLRSVGLR